ncbi:MAG: transcription elongation factor GreB [Cellvibrionales bacterium TMED49]|nr:transcription elongation factor GreB [Porticoccaceae bacterium]OUU38495.1 MAG: transcription elongation factor GreB [Cellvibrionales bacterium TMED49]
MTLYHPVYRPGTPKSAPYITADGAKSLRSELYQLWKIERPKVTQIVHEAAKNGDRSENGDYIYGKHRLREIDRRVRYLTKRIETATVVEKLPSDPSRVFFAAFVTLEDQARKQFEYRLVGADEINTQKNWISIDSPIARALVGKKINDTVITETPAGTRELTILNIRYQ